MHKSVSDSIKGAAAYLGMIYAAFPTAALGQTTADFESLDQGGGTISAAIVNAAQAIPALMALIFAGSFLIGLIFIVKGLYMLVQRADGANVGTPAVAMHFITGMVFIATIPSMNIGMNTIDQVGVSVLSYAPPRAGLSGNINIDACIVMGAIIAFIQLFGWIGFLRGWLLLKAQAEGTITDGIGRGWTFIIGGVLAANVCSTYAIIVATLRFDMMNVLTQGAGCGC